MKMRMYESTMFMSESCVTSAAGSRERVSVSDMFLNILPDPSVIEKNLVAEIPVLKNLLSYDVDKMLSATDSSELVDMEFASFDFDSLSNFVNTSQENYNKVMNLVETRAALSPDRAARLDHLNTAVNGGERIVSSSTFSSMRKQWNLYRNQTSQLLEVCMLSDFYEPSTAEWEFDTVGTAVETSTYDQDDPRWYSSRYDTVGGSDIGAIVMKDFVDPSEMDYFDRSYIDKVEKSKTNIVIPKHFSKALKDSVPDTTSKGKNNAAYRGTIWEDKIRDDFAVLHPEFRVFKTKNQYVHPQREWQRVNFDGVIASDGINPDQILEIKTGNNADHWANNGIPLKYRAQVLYYLNATGYEKATIVCLVNDGEWIERTLHKNDEVAPGTDINMETYITTRVAPWFENLRVNRVVEY